MLGNGHGAVQDEDSRLEDTCDGHAWLVARPAQQFPLHNGPKGRRHNRISLSILSVSLRAYINLLRRFHS